MNINTNTIKSVFPPKILLALLIGSLIFFYFIPSNTNSVFSIFSSMSLVVSIGLVVLHRPVWGILTLTFFLPLTSLWPDFSNSLFYGFPLVTSFMVIIGGLTLASVIIHVIENNIQLPKPQWEHGLAFLYVAWISIMHFDTAFTPEESTGRIWMWTYMQLLVLLVLSSILFRQHKHIRLLGYSILLGSLTSVVGGLFFGGFEISQQATFGIRLSGLSGNPNEFAVMCVISLACLNFFNTGNTTLKVKFLTYAAAGITLFGLVFSISRTGLVAAIIVSLILIMLRLRGRLSRIYTKSFSAVPIMLFVLGFGLTLVIIPSDYRDLWVGSIYKEISTNTGTTGIRIELWRISSEIFLEHPIIGVGTGNFPKYAAEKWSLQRSYRDAVVHNTYISVLTETGLVGFVIFMLFNILIIYKLIIYNKGSPIGSESKNVSYILIMILIIWGIFGVFSSGEYGKILWITNGAAIGLFSTIKKNDIKSVSPKHIP